LDELTAHASLFAVAFIAATILPLQSEAALVALLVLAPEQVVSLVAVASLGNTLGSVVNWAMGRWIDRFRDRRWFPVGPAKLAQAEGWYRRWGRWSLMLSWAPLIGDTLTLVAGMLRERLDVFLALVALAKTARYATLAAITLGVM
jgi:membrane protein YqaA with SNARE-associated domain